MLEEQDGESGYRDSPVVSEGVQEDLAPGAHPDVDNRPENFDDDDDLDLCGAIVGEFAQRDGVKWKSLDLHDECWTMKRRVSTNVTGAVESAQKSLQTTDALATAILPSEVSVSPPGETTTLAAELDKAKTRLVKFKSTETKSVCRHEELFEKLKKRHAEEVVVWKVTFARNADCLINDVKAAKVDRVKTSVERNLNLALFEEYDRALQDLFNGNVEQKITLTDA